MLGSLLREQQVQQSNIRDNENCVFHWGNNKWRKLVSCVFFIGETILDHHISDYGKWKSGLPIFTTQSLPFTLFC